MDSFRRSVKTAAILWLIGLCLLLLPHAQTALAAVGSPDDFVITIKTDNPGTSLDTEFTIPTHP